MRKTLAILFGGMICCLCSTMSNATEKVKADPMQIAIKALNLPDYEGYEEGARREVCILCAHPAQARWKETTEEPNSMLNKLNYNLTFIGLCDEIGMPEGLKFNEEMCKMGYNVLEGYKLLNNGTLDRLSRTEIEGVLCTHTIPEDWLVIYRKRGEQGYPVVIKCNITSKVFQKYAEEYLKNKFDAIIGDFLVDFNDTLFTGNTTHSLIESLKKGGVFISPDYSGLWKKIGDYVEMISDLMGPLECSPSSLRNPWVEDTPELDNSIHEDQWISVASDLYRSEYKGFDILRNNEFIRSWNVNMDTLTMCELEEENSSRLLGRIIIDGKPLGISAKESYPFDEPRILIAKVGSNSDISSGIDNESGRSANTLNNDEV